MKSGKNLQIQQLERKMAAFKGLPEGPRHGWINGIRNTLNMSLRQFGERMRIKPQSAQEIEEREQAGTITLKALRDAGTAMNMKLVYGFVPMSGSLEQLLEEQAIAVAQKIVSRTDRTMKLENQQVSKGRLEEAVKELAAEIKREMPRYLWD